MKISLFIAFFLFGSVMATGQSDVAHLNSLEILEAMPSYHEAILKIQIFEQEGRAELQSMITDLEGARRTCWPTQEEIILCGPMNDEKLEAREKELRERQESFQNEIQAYSQALNRPILERFEIAVEIVSDRNNFDYVFDISTLMIHNGSDITKEVIEEALKLEAASVTTPKIEKLIKNTKRKFEKAALRCKLISDDYIRSHNYFNMKNLILFALLFFGVTAASAQSKMAHLNSQELMLATPSYNEAVKKLEAYQVEVNTEIQVMIADFQAAIVAYHEKILDLPPILLKAEEEKIMKKEQAINERKQTVQTDIEAYSRELNLPIIELVDKAIKIVADRHNYDYVFDISIVMISNGPDITQEVIKEILILDGTVTSPPQEIIEVERSRP